MDMAAARFHLRSSSSLVQHLSFHSIKLISSSQSLPPSHTSQFFCSYSLNHSNHHSRSLSAIANNTLNHIHNSGVIACLRAQSSELAMEAACAAISGGVTVLEVIASTPGVFEVIQQLAQDFPIVTLGVGTVLNLEDAKNAINAGAKFLMSPVTVKDIHDDVQGSKTLYIPGVMTPTEIFTAYSSGSKIVKVYPVSAMGGPPYISALKKPFPHIEMLASQGITIDLIGEYIESGASSVVLSDAIFTKEAMSRQNFGLISQLAHLATLQANLALSRKRRIDGF